jgi:hypothetical protein
MQCRKCQYSKKTKQKTMLRVIFRNCETKQEILVSRSVCGFVGGSVKLLLTFASTIIPGVSLLEILGQDLYFLLDMYVFRNGASSGVGLSM